MGLVQWIKSVATTRLDAVVRWGRKHSLWPMPFGTACCAIELMATASSRYDISRFGAEVFRFSPRQADLLIVAGRISLKMMPVLHKIYQQMPEPKWVISMGACASCGGIFDNYAMIQGIDRFIPVDVYVPGCPPRPESLIDAVMLIQKRIERGEARQATIRGPIERERFLDADGPVILPPPRPSSMPEHVLYGGKNVPKPPA